MHNKEVILNRGEEGGKAASEIQNSPPAETSRALAHSSRRWESCCSFEITALELLAWKGKQRRDGRGKGRGREEEGREGNGGKWSSCNPLTFILVIGVFSPFLGETANPTANRSDWKTSRYGFKWVQRVRWGISENKRWHPWPRCPKNRALSPFPWLGWKLSHRGTSSSSSALSSCHRFK